MSYIKVLFIFIVTTSPMLTAQDLNSENRVLLREVRVRVVDKDGNHVPGLKPSDFQLSEDKESYAISYFEEIDFTRKAKEVSEHEGVIPFNDSHRQGPRRLTLIIDSANFRLHMFEEVQEQVESFIREELDSDTYMQIVHIDGDIYPLIGYTQNRDELIAALYKAEHKGKLYNKLKLEEMGIASQIAAAKKLQAGNRIMSRGQIGGRGVPRGAQMDMGRAYDESIEMDVRMKAYFKQMHYRKFTVQMLRIAHALREGRGSQAALLITAGQFVEENSPFKTTRDVGETLAQAFNGMGIPLFVHLAKPRRELLRNQIESESSFNFDYDSFARHSTLTSNRMYLSSNRTTIFENDFHMEGAPQYAADWTGGAFTFDKGASTIPRRLNELFTTAGQYYRLGFTRFIDDENAVVKTQIQLRDAKANGWKVIYGKEALPSYRMSASMPEVDLAPVDDGSLPAHVLLEAGMLGQNHALEYGHFHFPSDEDGYRVPVYLRILQENMSEKLEGYELGFAALDAEGNVLDHTTVNVRPKEGGQDLLVYDLLTTEQQPSIMRFFVRDQLGMVYSLQELKFDQTRDQVSDLVLSDTKGSDIVLSAHHQDRNRKRAKVDPFFFDKTVYPFKAGKQDFEAPNLIGFFLAMKPTSAGSPYSFGLYLTDAENQIVKPGFNVELMEQTKHVKHQRLRGIVDVRGLKPGYYRMIVQLIDPDTKAEFLRSKVFKISASEAVEP